MTKLADLGAPPIDLDVSCTVAKDDFTDDLNRGQGWNVLPRTAIIIAYVKVFSLRMADQTSACFLVAFEIPHVHGNYFHTLYVYFEYHTVTVTCAPLGLQDRLVDGDVWICIAKKASWIWEQSAYWPHRSGRLYKGAAGQGQEEECKLQTCHPLSNQERDNRLCWHQRPEVNTVRAPIWKTSMLYTY